MEAGGFATEPLTLGRVRMRGGRTSCPDGHWLQWRSCGSSPRLPRVRIFVSPAAFGQGAIRQRSLWRRRSKVRPLLPDAP